MKWSKAQDGWKSSWKFVDWMEPTIKKKPRKKLRKQAKETEAAMDEEKIEAVYRVEWSWSF